MDLGGLMGSSNCSTLTRKVVDYLIMSDPRPELFAHVVIRYAHANYRK